MQNKRYLKNIGIRQEDKIYQIVRYNRINGQQEPICKCTNYKTAWGIAKMLDNDPACVWWNHYRKIEMVTGYGKSENIIYKA